MKQSKTIKKRSLVVSIAVLTMCIAALIGATFAWFTDTASTATNKIQAGNLDVDLVMYKTADSKYASIADADEVVFGAANSLVAQDNNQDTVWEPGKTQIAYLGVKNAGNLALKYTINLTVTDNGLADALEYAFIEGAKYGDLASVSDWTTLKANATQAGNVTAGKIQAAPEGLLDEIAISGEQDETDYFVLAIHMKEDAGNSYKTKTADIDVTIKATQVEGDYDSFGNDYDKASWFNTSMTSDVPPYVETIAFVESGKEPATYDATGISPRNTVAYYNETTKALTYVLDEGYDKLEFDDSTLLKFGVAMSEIDVPDEMVLEFWNEILCPVYAEAVKDDPQYSGLFVTYEDIEDFKNFQNGVYYTQCLGLCTKNMRFCNVTQITGLNLWDVSKVTDFSYMFWNFCSLTSLDLSGWDTSSATTMKEMFDTCSSLETLKLSDTWNTSNVKDMSYMFDTCEKLQNIPTSNWDTKKVENMTNTFGECRALTYIDLSSWDTSNVVKMNRSFIFCDELQHIYVGDGGYLETKPAS